MMPFRSIDDAHPALSHSLILRAAQLLIGYVEENGPIGLTTSKALKRYFVAWTAEAFEWPGYTAKDLYAINKVLNEDDFPPLAILHEVLLSAKLARHYKGALRLSKYCAHFVGLGCWMSVVPAQGCQSATALQKPPYGQLHLN